MLLITVLRSVTNKRFLSQVKTQRENRAEKFSLKILMPEKYESFNYSSRIEKCFHDAP